MRDLSSVALCCVDTRTPLLALNAMQRCMQGLRFGDAILFAVPEPSLLDRAAVCGVRVVGIDKLASIEAYARFMLRDLSVLIHHDFILVVQWDGFVLHPESWTDEFLKYDYIGAIWPEAFSRYSVGNGGFSLRSRKLLQVLREDDIQITYPEDLCICDVNRHVLERKYGISFAPTAVAARFAYEHLPPEITPFGFHGTFNLIDAFAPSDLLRWIKSMPSEMFFAAGMRRLAKNLIMDGQYESAWHILVGRLRKGDRRWRIISLMLRLALRRQLRLPPDKLKL